MQTIFPISMNIQLKKEKGKQAQRFLILYGITDRDGFPTGKTG
jgi:hypothetical protein